MRLTLEELAREAETEPARIERLIAAGIVHRDPDGLFGPGDIQRAKLVGAFEGAGIAIDRLERAVADHQADFETVDFIYPAPSRRSERTYAEFATSLGKGARLLGPLHVALGLAEPDLDRSLTERDEDTLMAFLEAWDLGSDEIATRAARIMAEAVHRAAEGWVDLFYEHVSDPVQRRALEQNLPVEEMIPQIIPAAGRVAALAPRMLTWLLDRHLEQILHARNIDSAEEQFVARGLAPPKPTRPPAIVFADLAGFTHLTQSVGDQEAARMAVRLGELAGSVAQRHGGRLVKLLGDGALLRFDGAPAAVFAALDLVAQGPDTGLPPVHVGVHAGPIIVRDGDVYGHTVNVASRVAGVAGAAEVVVSAEVVAEIHPTTPIDFEPIGSVELKGVTEPLDLHRAARRTLRDEAPPLVDG